MIFTSMCYKYCIVNNYGNSKSSQFPVDKKSNLKLNNSLHLIQTERKGGTGRSHNIMYNVMSGMAMSNPPLPLYICFYYTIILRFSSRTVRTHFKRAGRWILVGPKHYLTTYEDKLLLELPMVLSGFNLWYIIFKSYQDTDKTIQLIIVAKRVLHLIVSEVQFTVVC